MKTLVKQYLRFVWNYAQGYYILTIPLTGVSVLLSICTFIAVEFGAKLTPLSSILLVGGAIVTVSIVGDWMVKKKIPAYYQSMNNSVSPELIKILKEVEELKKMVEAKQ